MLIDYCMIIEYWSCLELFEINIAMNCCSFFLNVMLQRDNRVCVAKLTGEKTRYWAF